MARTNKKLPVIPAGGFSVVSLPGSSRLRRSLALVTAASRLSFSPLKLLKNRYAGYNINCLGLLGLKNIRFLVDYE